MSFRHHHFIYLPYLAVSLSAQSLEPLVVTGKSESLIGEASSASKGQASAEELAKRPLLRRGKLLEVVPGVTILNTQVMVRRTNILYADSTSIMALISPFPQMDNP